MAEAYREHLVNVHGTELRLFRGGRGQPLMLLHGASPLQGWPPLAERLSQSFEVFLPETPGFGERDVPEWVRAMDDYAFFYLDLLDQLGLEGLHLFGKSIGGWLAMELATMQPGRFDRMVLAASVGLEVPEAPPADLFFLVRPEEKAAALYTDPAMRARMAEQLLSGGPSLPSIHAQKALARIGWERLYNPRLAGRLHRIKSPALLLWGELDAVVSPTYGRALARALPNARLEMIPNTGHMLDAEQPEKVAQAATAFFLTPPVAQSARPSQS